MQIQPSDSSAGLAFQQSRLAQDKNIQGVFSAILSEAGREGYASSAPLATGAGKAGQGVESQAATAWDDWYRTEQSGRYASIESVESRDALGKQFGEVIQKALAEGGYVDPKGFLSSLTRDELAAVQNIQWLADPIDINGLSDEGALNLLIPPAAQVDANHDGLTQSGAAYGLRFPDSNTPADVTQAWEKATEGMPFSERMVYELQVMLPVMTANIVLNDDGSYSHTREPGDPDFTNPMDGAGTRFFAKLARDWIEHLDYLEHQLEPERYEKDRAFWQSFNELLEHE